VNRSDAGQTAKRPGWVRVDCHLHTVASGDAVTTIDQPAERAEANKRSSASGKRRVSRQRINSTPTAPVAPTIATTGAVRGVRACIAVAST